MSVPVAYAPDSLAPCMAARALFPAPLGMRKTDHPQPALAPAGGPLASLRLHGNNPRAPPLLKFPEALEDEPSSTMPPPSTTSPGIVSYQQFRLF